MYMKYNIIILRENLIFFKLFNTFEQKRCHLLSIFEIYGAIK